MTSVLPRQEALLHHLCQRIEESQATQAAMMRLLGNFRQIDVNMASDNAAALSESLESPAVTPTVARPRMRSRNEFHVQNLQIQSACPLACTCNCHKVWRIYSPWRLEKIFGYGKIEGVGLPFLKGACSRQLCKGNSATFVNINYFLPTIMAARMISLWFTSSPHCGPELLLRVSRVVRTDTAAYHAICFGDLNAVKRCISAGECKPWDVDDCGQSLIAVCHLSILYVFCLLTLAYPEGSRSRKFYDRLVSCTIGFRQFRVPQRRLSRGVGSSSGWVPGILAVLSLSKNDCTVCTNYESESF